MAGSNYRHPQAITYRLSKGWYPEVMAGFLRRVLLEGH
jgi:hypothetical protein